MSKRIQLKARKEAATQFIRQRKRQLVTTRDNTKNWTRFYESALVILLLLSAGALLVASMINTTSSSCVCNHSTQTPAFVDPGGPLSAAIRLFHFDTGVWPTNLQELIVCPNDPAIAKKWSKPYLERAQDFLDPWGNPIQYLVGKQAMHNIGRFDLWSFGSDGIEGTPDDIKNWSP